MPVLRKVALFTNEYPPNVYGGAGVHVEYLGRALAKLLPVEVRCFGEPGGASKATPPCAATRAGRKRSAAPTRASPAPSTLSPARLRWPRIRSTRTWSTATPGTPTWPASWQEALGRPFVLTIHSLEPLRPWKVEQLGNAYHLSTWMERTAIEEADAMIAVSQRDPRRRAAPLRRSRRSGSMSSTTASIRRSTAGPRPSDALVRHGVDPGRPYVLFVGRITRQKGIIHLVNAIPEIDPALQVVPVRRRARHAGDRPGDGGAGRRGQRRAPGRDLDPGDAAAGGGDPALHPRRGLLLPLGLRAVRHHQPGGDGLRDGGGRLGGRRHPRGRRARARPACWSSRSSTPAPSSRSIPPRSRRGSPPRSTGSPATPSSGRASAATAAAARSSSSAGTPLPRGPSISTGRCYRALGLQRHSGWVRSSQSSTGFCQRSRQQVSPVLS